VYATQAGLPAGYHYGASTLTKDLQTLYLICFDRPNGQVAVKGIRNDVKAITVQGQPLTYRKLGGAPWINLPGVLWIDVPDAAFDPIATVIKIELAGPLDLFTGKAFV
jgi:alpha-L-fucosidase